MHAPTVAEAGPGRIRHQARGRDVAFVQDKGRQSLLSGHFVWERRDGHEWHYCMKCVDRNQGDFYGMESWGLAVYDEIEVPERLVYTDYFSDVGGEVNADLPSSQTTLTFEEAGEGTRVVRHRGRAEDCDGHGDA